VACLVLLGASCSLYRPDGGPWAGAEPDPEAAESLRFQSIADAFIAWYHAVHPTRATTDGVHDHDGHLGQFTREHLESRQVVLRDYLRRLGQVEVVRLDDESYYDHAVLDSTLRAMLLDLETVRSWEKNPNFYREPIAGGLYSLATLSFDTPERRMAASAERLSEVPLVLAVARLNLSNPPRIYTEMAIEEFAGTHAFLKTDLPAAFKSVTDETVRKRFAEQQKPAMEAVEQFVDWMRKDLLPKSTGDFALGRAAYQAKLLHEEGVNTPVDELLAQGRVLLVRTQEQMKKLCGDRPVRAALRESSREHPPAERLLADARALMEELKGWASTLVDVPADAACAIQETPSFRRTTSFASMEIPGPFERVAKEAYYSITLPDPSWSPEKQEQHLSFFNRFTLPLISVHEAYPGHYTQFLAVQSCRSRVRKVFGSGAFSEGWAHYCEQLYVDERKDAPPELRLHQLSMTLLRICRFLAGIGLHTQGMTYEQAVELFVNEGYLERANAEREARRGTADPMFLVYTLGKHEILRLRDDYLARTGRPLRDFHNGLLKHGYPPLRVARMILLGERPAK
jgi:uncharacterized protein (DUF885 family)